MRYLLIVALTFLNNISFCQSTFQNIGFNEALNQSQKTGKLVLIQLESSDCEMCNYVGDKAFEDATLSKKVNEIFITIYISTKSSDRNLINGLLNLTNQSFGTIFIDGNKNIIHRIEKTTSQISEYNKEIDEVLYKSSEVIRLNTYEDIYLKSKLNSDLELWILARDKLNIDIDSLLNIYVNTMPKDSINSTKVLEFLARMAPLKESVPDKLLRNNAQFNTVWYSIALNLRISINNKIVAKSMKKAIEEKNEQFAISIANFRRNTYDNNIQSGKNAFYFQILGYYQAVKNIDKFMLYSNQYYDEMYKNMSVDSVSKIDSIRRLAEMKNTELKEVNINGVTKKVRAFTFKPISQTYTNLYNNAAWFVYKNTHSKSYLEKALMWAHRANEHFKSFEAMDTEARILYKLGNKTDAILLMGNAIKLKNERIKSSMKFSSLDNVLNEMKQNKEVID